jgi:hypothetical protein
VISDAEYERFVTQPYTFCNKPEEFMKFFNMAWASKRAPGQQAAPIPDVAPFVLRGFQRIAEDLGYDFLEMAPSHYHVARWGLGGDYLFRDPVQEATFNAFSEGLERIRASGMPLTRTQQSWVCVVQSLQPSSRIPVALRLSGPQWPQDNIGPKVLWLYKPLSERAKGFKPAPLHAAEPAVSVAGGSSAAPSSAVVAPKE